MVKFLKFIEQHAKTVFFAILAITLVFAYFALNIRINADIESLMPWEEASRSYFGGVSNQNPDLSPTGLINEKIEIDPLYPATYFILIKGDNIYSPKSLNAIDDVITRLEETEILSESFSIFDSATFEKSGSRLKAIPFDAKVGNWTNESATIFKQRVESDPNIRYSLAGGDLNSFLFAFGIKNTNEAKLNELKEIITSGLDNSDLTVNINGSEVINWKIMNYLKNDLFLLVFLCLLIILIVYYLIFRSKRSVFLPISLAVIALIWTFGSMSMFNIEITVLNIIIPCMVLILGTSYSIHVISEFYSLIKENDNTSPILAVKRVTKTILFAALTTIFGFLALCIAQTEELRVFGISVSIGLIYCAGLSCTYLPAVLTMFNNRKRGNPTTGFNILGKIVNYLAIIIVKYWYVFLSILALIIIIFLSVYGSIPVNTNYMAFFPEKDSFASEIKEFSSDVGGIFPFVVKIKAPENSNRFFLDSQNLTHVYNYEQEVLKHDDILAVISFSSYISHINNIMNNKDGIPESSALMNLFSRQIISMQNQDQTGGNYIISEDGNTLELVFRHWDAELKDTNTVASMTRVLNSLVENLNILPKGTEVLIDGEAIVNIKFQSRLVEDQNNSTAISILFVFILVSIAFLSIFKAFFTIIPVIAGIMINYLFMYIFNFPFDIVTIMSTSIAIGCGIDDAIHFMLRYKYKIVELPLLNVQDQLTATIKETGKPIIITTISLVAGMSMLSFASFTPIRSFGLLMSVSLLSCMISTLIFLPPMIILFSKFKKETSK